MIKLIRALKNGENVCKKYEGRPEFKMKGDDYLQAAHAAMDSSSEQPMRYVQHFDIIRMVGFEEGWANVPIEKRDGVPKDIQGNGMLEALEQKEKVPMAIDVTG